MKQTSSFSGLDASPAGEKLWVSRSYFPQTPADFLRQNANILADAHFLRETKQVETYLTTLCTKRDTVLDVLDDYTQHWLDTASVNEAPDAEMDNYHVVLDVLQQTIPLTQTTLELCRWMAQQYSLRLRIDADRFAELEFLRTEVPRLKELVDLTDDALFNVAVAQSTFAP